MRAGYKQTWRPDLVLRTPGGAVSRVTVLQGSLETATTLDADTLDGHHASDFALAGHNHDLLYAALEHNHDLLYAALEHNHDLLYATLDHNHDLVYAAVGHDHDLVYAALEHNHDSTYAALVHTHDYAASDHNHDLTYAAIVHVHDYAASNHNHDQTYSPLSHASNHAEGGADELTPSDIGATARVTEATAGNLASLTAEGDLADSGISPRPYLPGITSRHRRILCLGDSMFGGLLASEVTAAVPESDALVLGFGGEFPASGAVALASDIKYRGRAGNLLADSRITQWNKDRAVLSESSFSTGQACYKWAGDNSYTGSSLWVDAYPPDEGIVEGLTFSFLVEPSALVRGWYGAIYVNTTRLAWFNVPNLDIYPTFAPMRYRVYIPPGQYSSGDYIRFEWWHADGPSGDYALYFAEAQLQLGSVALPYRETTGVADTPAAEDWHGSPDALNRRMFDLVAFCYRNPGGYRSTLATELQYEALTDTASTVVPRVLLMEPTPLRDTGNNIWLTGANDASDVPNDLFGAVKRVAAKRNVFHKSVRDDFIDSGITPSTLVGDSVHPTDAGDARIAALIADTVASNDDKVPTKITGGACVRMGGTETGVWTDYAYEAANYRFDLLAQGIPLSCVVVGPTLVSEAVRETTATGATVTYKVSGRQIGLLYLLKDPGGVVSVAVDGLPPVEVSLESGTYAYMRTRLLLDDNGPIIYPDGEHTVVVTRVSGTVRLFGCVGLGANLELDVDRASRVSGATAGNFACLTADGDLADSGKNASSQFTPSSHASSHNAGGGDALAVDAAAATGSLRTLGTASTSACAGNDSRLSDARIPTAHAASHADGGSDEVTPLAIGAPSLHGFVNRTDSTLGMSSNKLQLTTGSNFSFWVNGNKFTKNTTQEVTISNNNTLHYVYYDNAGTLQVGISPWSILDLTVIPVATVYKTLTEYAVGEERHSYLRNLPDHEWKHTTVFARWKSGFTGTFNNTSFSITTGITSDEDIDNNSGGTKTACRMWYRNSGATSMTFDSNVTYPWKNNSGPQYDNGGTMTPVGNAKLFNSYVYGSNDKDYPIYFVVGQAQHNNIASARAEAQPAILLSTAEWKLLYRVTYQESGGSAVLVETLDLRQQSTGPATSGFTPTSHLGLTDIGTNTHAAIDLHLANTSNPHSVTASQAGALPTGTKLDDLGTPDDNTDLDATTGRHGLLPKLGGGTTNFLRADGTWAPAGSGDSCKETVTVTHAFAAGDVVYRKSDSTWAKAKADTVGTAEALGVIESVSTTVSFVVVYSGKIMVSGASWTDGSVYFLSASTAGALTATEPTTVGHVSRPILVATSSTTGVVMQYRGMVIGDAADQSIADLWMDVGSTKQFVGSRYLRRRGC